MKNIVILQTQSGDWEGLFIDGQMISEGHHLGEGDRLYLLEMAEQYNFKSSDIRICELNNEDEDIVNEFGNFPAKLTDFKGSY